MTTGSGRLIIIRMGAHDGARFTRPRSTISMPGVEHAMHTTSACVGLFRVSVPIHFSVVAMINRGNGFRVRRVGRTFLPPLFWRIPELVARGARWRKMCEFVVWLLIVGMRAIERCYLDGGKTARSFPFSSISLIVGIVGGVFTLVSLRKTGDVTLGYSPRGTVRLHRRCTNVRKTCRFGGGC